MNYHPVITHMHVEDEHGNLMIRLEWSDEVSIQVTTTPSNPVLTNAEDWLDLSAAIHAALVRMEQCTPTAMRPAGSAATPG